MDLLIAKRKPVMLVGSAGSGKTVSVAAKLNALSDSYAVTNVPLNFYTTSGRSKKNKIHKTILIKQYLLSPIFIRKIEAQQTENINITIYDYRNDTKGTRKALRKEVGSKLWSTRK